jgi:hypothetical protein
VKYMILLYASQEDYDLMAGKPTDKPAWSAEDIAFFSPWILLVCTGAARPRASTNSPDSTSSWFHDSISACIARSPGRGALGEPFAFLTPLHRPPKSD